MDHRQHKVRTIENKIAEIRDSLKNALKESNTDLKAISERREELMHGREDVETSTQNAIEQMRQQLNDVTAKLSSVYHTQVTKVKETKGSQLLQFNEETDKLRKLDQKKKTFSDHVEMLLDQPVTEGFVNQAKSILQEKPDEQFDFFSDTRKWWRKRVYEPPEVHSDQLYDYVEKLLGHFKEESAQEERIGRIDNPKINEDLADSPDTNIIH